MLRVILKSEVGGGCLFKGMPVGHFGQGGGGGLLGRRCLLEGGHREIRYMSVNPNFLDD